MANITIASDEKLLLARFVREREDQELKEIKKYVVLFSFLVF